MLKGDAMKGYLLSLFALLSMVLLIIASGAFTTVLMERNVSLTLADDTYGMIALAPALNGQYFVDRDGDGAYELYVPEAPRGTVVELPDVFSITNNLNRTVRVSVTDEGIYDDAVSFTVLSQSLEFQDVTIPVGTSVLVSVTINVPESSGDLSLLSGVSIVVRELAHDELITLSRGAEIYAVDQSEPGDYDPAIHTMLENAEYVRRLAFAILESGGTIRTWGALPYVDMGLPPNIWNKTINGFTIKYNVAPIYNAGQVPTVQVSPKDHYVYAVTVDTGTPVTLYLNQSMYLGVYDMKWYMRIDGVFREIIITEY